MTPATYALVDEAAVKHNIHKIKESVGSAKIMAVIKANAYGHGLLRIADALENIDAIAVARSDEGIKLRNQGVTARIVILEGFVAELELQQLIEFNLDFVVHSIGQIDIIERYQGKKPMNVWLKLDTGMNRLGINGAEFSEAYRRLQKCFAVFQPICIMSHFSSADDLHCNETDKQIQRFDDLVNSLPGEKSLANSAAILAWPNSIKDWVRPGIMLYGVSPFADKVGHQLGLKAVMSLHSRLISVKHVSPGETVGYSRTWTCDKPTRLGVVAIGYGDGYPRYARNGTPVLVNGQRVALVGRVSMDMITVDLSSQPDATAGDPVTLWGKDLAVEEIAKYADTIPYTLLCGITQRVDIQKI